MAEILEGVVNNQPTSANSGNTPLRVQMTPLGSVKVANLEPAFLELSREGKIWTVTTTVAVAVAPLVVVPTTTAAFVLYNNDAAGGKLIVPLLLSCYLGSGTSDIGNTLMAQCTSTPLATPLTANGTGHVISNTRGGVSSGVAFADASKTVAGGWAAVGNFASAASAVPGIGVTVNVAGMFCIRPTYALGLHVTGGLGTSAKFSFSCTYLEIPGLTP